MSSQIKQVIIIRKDLKMRRGKEIAQGCHASMKIFFDRMEQLIWNDDPWNYEYILRANEELAEWKEGAFTKICLKVNSEEELLEIVRKAGEADIPVALIEDSGKTEFNGIPTKTCCAIGPARVEEIDKITGDLSLY